MGREEGAAKVGAGETAVCVACGRPLAQALGEVGSCAGALGDCGAQEIRETSVWLFDTWEAAIKRDSEAISSERLARKAQLEVYLAAFRQFDLSFDGFRVKCFGGPLIDAYKSLRAIHELSPHVVECFFKDCDLAALSVCIETMTTATGELRATFHPSVALVEFIAAHRADDGD